MRVHLIPMQEGPPIEVDRDLLLVGRNEICDVQLSHKSVSKLHCVIVKTGDGLLLVRDLGSTNGTRVNGARIRRGALLPEDQLNIAGLAFRVEITAGKKSDVNPEQYTQRLDAGEVADLMKRADKVKQTERDESFDPDSPPVQTNSLPDVYEEDSAPRSD